jgi:hypothetical protein
MCPISSACERRYLGLFAWFQILTLVSDAISLFQGESDPKSQNNAHGKR